jgi:hypothetical protein
MAQLEEVRKKDIAYPSVPLAPVIVSATTAAGTADAEFEYQIEASGSPVEFGASGLPHSLGLSLNPETGDLSGIPMETGTFSATISASNLGGTGDAPLKLVMGEPSQETANNQTADERKEDSRESASEAKKNPPDFQRLQGAYTGLGALDGTNEALFTMSVRPAGEFTGKLVTGDGVYPVGGKFSRDGTFDGVMDSGSAHAALSMDAGVVGISGTISVKAPGEIRAYSVAGSPLGRFSAANPPAIPAGLYTAVIPGITGTDPAVPQGAGYGLMNVSKTGLVSIGGKLGDGTPFNARCELESDGKTWTVFDTLYAAHRHGTLAGTMTFGTCSYCDCSGTMDWVKPAQTSAHYYPAGFGLRVEMVAAQYTAPPLASGSASVTLTGGSIADLAGITDDLVISSTGAVTVSGPNYGDVTIKVKPDTGEFSGTFTNPGSAAATPFTGVIYQKPTPGGFGMFLDSDQSGAVTLTQ